MLLASVSEEPDDALRVLFIEDCAIDGGFLTDKLSQQGIVVRTVGSLAGASDVACDADVIVLHCKRVNNSSIELLGKLLAPGLDIPAVLLTGEAAPAHECLALDKGAIDVTPDPQGPEDLAMRSEAAGHAGKGVDHGCEARAAQGSAANQLFACNASMSTAVMAIPPLARLKRRAHLQDVRRRKRKPRRD